MNVTSFPFRFLFSLLTPRSVTTYLLQVADERSSAWSNEIIVIPLSTPTYSALVCVCVFVHWGSAGLVAVSFSLFCLP